MRFCLIICTLLYTLVSTAQTKESLTIIRLDYQMKVTKDSLAFSYYELLWQEGGLWTGQLYNFPEGQLIRSCFYTQADRKTKTGVAFGFHPNGAIRDSSHYQNNKLEGTYKTWYENGMPKSVENYNQGLPVDTALFWFEDGTVNGIRITDSLGNGKQQWMDTTGTVTSIGVLRGGERGGKWLFKRPDGSVEMEVMFDHDSVTNTQCFDEKGILLSGSCIYEQEARFPGGLPGWKRFLERNLRYPEAAINAGIMGTVKVTFNVAKDGQLSDFKVVSSPSNILSEEALRIMRKSPLWEPAIQRNRPVIYRHIQGIGFYLQ